ncbi:DNA cytosine methyltransferase [Bosea sp. TWI1241]|uniref:DNA cytosine methyltransferase n=1 Tax=Bosea sp. TWI1241 TaxID=3148904 RepID=UPI0032088A1F
MKLVELFCGCGGFSLGAHKAGFEVAAAYDVDPILTHSYRLNFPRTKLVLRDVAPLTGAEIEADVGEKPFGIFGGPPCQGFSDIGKRDKGDPRRQLLRHFFRIVSEVEPTFFVMENVRGLAYQDARPVLDDALGLVSDRYDILDPIIWDAAQFGAATRRNRMFVIGVLKDRKAPITRQDVEAFKRKPATVKQAIADLMGAREAEESETLPGFDRWRIHRRGLPSDYAMQLRAPDNIFTGHRPTAHTEVVVARFAKVKPGKTEPIGRHPRLKQTGQCPTLRAGTGSDKGSFQSVRPIHPTEHRVITVREAARLQGFPDAHVFHPTIWHSFRMIGNSVSPFMSEAIFRAIRARLEKVTSDADEPGEHEPPLEAMDQFPQAAE